MHYGPRNGHGDNGRHDKQLQVPADIKADDPRRGCTQRESHRRAGRDGEPATCTLIYRIEDRRTHQFFMGGKYPNADDIVAVRDALVALNGSAEPIILSAIQSHASTTAKSKLRSVLTVMKDAGLVRELRGSRFRLTAEVADAARLEDVTAAYVQRKEADRAKLERMAAYAQSGSCRWKLLLEYFDEPDGLARCGECDNCRNPRNCSMRFPWTTRTIGSISGTIELSNHNATEAGVTDKVRFIQGDLFEADLSQATVITLFLLPQINEKLRPKILDLKPGTRVVSNSFTMDEWEADQTETVTEDCTSWCTALMWIVPAKVEGTWTTPQGDLQLKQNFQMVTGTLGGQGIDERLRGDQFTFSAGGTKHTVTVNGSTMQGGNFEATKK